MDSVPTLNLHSLRSRNFTKAEISEISALYHGIAYSLLRKYLLTAYAMPPADRSGAVGVGALQSSDITLVIITRCGTLLLSLREELDVFTVELVMNFTRGFMEGPPDMSESDIPVAVDYHTQAATRIGELEEQEKLMYALREIAETSEDAESVRVAFIALSTTTAGQTYLRGNPIKL